MIDLLYWIYLKVMYGEPIEALHVILAIPITQLERKKELKKEKTKERKN